MNTARVIVTERLEMGGKATQRTVTIEVDAEGKIPIPPRHIAHQIHMLLNEEKHSEPENIHETPKL